MNPTPKTPAELKAEEIKKNEAPVKNENVKENDKAEPTFTQAEVDAQITEATKELNDETADLNNQLETAKEERDNATKEKETLETKVTDLESASAKAKTIKPNDLKGDEEEKGNSLETEYFVVTATNASVSFSGFQFFKKEKYAITGRNKKAIETLIARKLGKKVKK